jgi:site-specific DNA recombinase
MKVALYARVSTERQAERGTIGSQLQVLRERVTAGGDELAGEYIDDGQSGARLDRPGLDALRDAAEAGLFELVWCLSPDRLARAYAYQVLVLDELARFGVTVRFTDAPDLAAGDPQAVLLTQVQGVIAEYEKAKIAERYRRGKLFRARAGEIITWKTAYGYRRAARAAGVAAHLEIYEPEAAVVRRIFADRAAGITVREICRRLNADRVPSPTGKPTWGTSTLCRLLGNEAYVGRVYFNRTETIADPRPARRTRQVPRPREDWIPISCPRIITDEQFEAAGRVAYDNAKWSPRRAEPGEWLLKGLVKCGACDAGTNCHKMRGRNGTWHRYYYCRNHDPLRAGGEDRRCPERNIRADALDEFVFDQIRAALTKPEMLLAGEQAIAVTTPIPDDELLAAELARLDRKIDATTAERRRVADLYQAGLIELPELQRRSSEVAARLRDQQAKRDTLGAERTALAHGNLLRRRVTDFARQIHEVIDQLDRPQKQQLLRLLIEDVHVTGWQVKIRLRVPLDPPDPGPTRPGPKRNAPLPTTRPTVSSQDRLRSADADQQAMLFPELAAEPAIYACSFICTNLDCSTPARAAAVEHWYRHRTSAENIFRDSKHGAALRHLPSGHEQVNTAWMWASLLAAAIAAWLHQLTGLIDGGELVEGHGVRGGKAMIATLRRVLIAVPARLVSHGRQLIMRLAPGPCLLPEILAAIRALPAPG